MLSALRVVPVHEGVHLPFVHAEIKDGVFSGSAQQTQPALTMLGRWVPALRVLRAA